MSQNDPHGSSIKQPQVAAAPQLVGIGMQLKVSGSPPMSETPRWQYSLAVLQVAKPHAN